MKALPVEMNYENPAMRVAVLYFGMARSVALTFPSIQRNLFSVSENKNITFTSLASLNLPKIIHNPRAHEEQVVLDPAENLRLTSDHFFLSGQSDDSIKTWLAIAQKKYDIFKNDWISLKNLLHQLLSLKRGWESLHAIYPEGFNYYLFLRPDLLYLDPFNLSDLIQNIGREKGIALPVWHSFRGLNDRLAFAGPAAAKAYASRIDLIGRFCEKRPLHAEQLLAFALSEADCKICKLPVRAKRVRSTGAIKMENFEASLSPLTRKPQPFKYNLARGISFMIPEKDETKMPSLEEKLETRNSTKKNRKYQDAKRIAAP